MKGAKLSVFVSSLLVVLGFLATAPSGLGQHPPYIYMWSPTNGATYLAPANLTLYARAVGNTNPVQTVQFFAGDTSLGVVTNLPGVQVTNVEPLYPLAWSNVLAGKYALKAVATDVVGLSATSSVVSISVVTNLPPPPVVRPSVYIYAPLSGSLYLAPANLTLYARATETTGTVQSVEFFAGDTSLGIVSNSSQVVVSNISSAPVFPLAWPNVGAGNYALKAVATDAKGVTATSSVVNITVVANAGNLPLAVRLPSPTNGQTYTALARIVLNAQAVDSNVVQTVQFFAGTTSLGTVTNTRGVLLTNWTSANSFSLVWSNVTPGSYPLTAVAVDAAGVTATSPPVNITVLWPPPPAVSMAYPTNGQTFYTPVNIYVHAQVADLYAPVLTMQYFANGTRIGIVTNAQGVMVTNLNSGNPFFLSWSNVTAGVYALTAVATDSLGLMATSPPVNITVIRPPPTITLYSPATGQVFYAPASITLNPRVMDLNAVVKTVEYFANGTSIGLVSNKTGVMLTNLTSSTPFYFTWTNVVAGTYTLTALATDAGGYAGTSAPVTITVVVRPPPNIPLAVGWLYPTNGQTFTAPANIGLHAWVVDSNIVQTVQYFAGTNSLGIVSNTTGVLLTNADSANSFYLLWSNVQVGAYTLTAVATDSGGNVATSLPVNLTVVSPPPPPPVPPYVYIYSPTNGATYIAPANLTLYARAGEGTGTVQTVEFFAGTNSLGVVSNSSQIIVSNLSSAPLFPLGWSNVAVGNYELKAVATDAHGLTATSSVVRIYVITKPPPPNIPLAIGWLYPTNGQTFTAPANIGLHAWVVDSNIVQTVQYFAGTNSLGIVSNTAGVLLTNAGAANSFYLLWSNVQVGVYTLTAVATDSGGNVATSPPVNITVVSPPPPPVLPYVYIYSPTDGAKFIAPANLTLYARAGEGTGTVQIVEFFAGTNTLGVVSNSTPVNAGSAPFFALGWSNVSVGNYELRAVATDALGMTATSSVVRIYVITNPPPPNVPLAVGFYYPTNGQTFTAPANIGVHAWVVDSNVVRTVQYFAGTNSIGVVSNTTGVLLTNTGFADPFFLLWSNVPASEYALTALATDSTGNMATSAPVNIKVLSPPPPPPVLPYVYIYSPPNGATYIAPANLTLYARAYETTGTVQTVEFFAGTNSLGVVPNSSQIVVSNLSSVPLFPLGWSNVVVGNYELRAVATDARGMTATSSVVRLYVTLPPANRPPEVRIISPPNAAQFRSPVNVPIYAYAHDADGFVTSVEFFAGTNSLGLGSTVGYGTNHLPSSYYTNIFSITWTNPPVDSYALTAKATDNSNAFTVSLPVKITILPPSPPPTNHYTYVGLAATDPVAIEGTNCWTWSSLTNATPAWTNWPAGVTTLVTNCGPKNATFTVTRSGDTNTALRVTYAIGGTASNGVDYVALPGLVEIPAGQRSAMISVVPLDEGPPDISSTVILKLTPSTNSPPAYVLNSTAGAEAVILDGTAPTPQTGPLADKTFHINASGPNGAWFHVEYSADMVSWTPVCTNQVVNGSIDFIDPDASSADARFYRAVPESNPPQ